MKKRFLIVLLLFCFVAGLSSCNDDKTVPPEREEKEENQLLAPENLRYTDGILKWSIVDHASGYVVVVDLDEYSVTENSLNLNQISLSNGNHNAKVRCVGNDKYLSSEYSNSIYFDYQKPNLIDPDKTDFDTDIFDNFNDSKEINVYIGEGVNELNLSNSINLNDKYYMWYYDLGTIRRAPIYSSKTYQFNYKYDVKFEFNELSSETISQATTLAEETIDTHSTTNGTTIGFEKNVNLSSDIEVVNTSVQFKDNQSKNYNWTNNWGSIETISNTISNMYLSQYSNGYSIELSFSEENGFEKGKFYRVSFYETLKAYGVLIYDVDAQEYKVAYQTFFDANSQMCIIEESKDGVFNYGNKNSLSFDVAKAIELSSKNIPLNKYVEPEHVEEIMGNVVQFITPSNTLKIDLSKYQENGNLDDFSKYDNFNDGVLTIYPAIDYKDIYNIEIIGAYKQKDKNGKIIGDDHILNNFSIYFVDDWDRDICLTIKNLAFSSSARSAISTNTNLILNVIGENKIITTNGNQSPVIFCGDLVLKGNGSSHLSLEAAYANNGQKGADCFVCNTMEIEDIDLSAIAGNGGSSTTGNGGTGGVALKLSGNLFIYKGTTLNAVGGDGGAGANGLSSTTSKNVEYYARRGYDGGTGGAGITCNFIFIDEPTSNSISISGGTGGVGGNGGRCQSGGQWASSNLQNILAGGSGGNGGTGGNAIEYKSKNYDNKIMSVGDAKLIFGKGNIGGKKGSCDETNPFYKPSKNGYPAGYKDGNKGTDGVDMKQVA